MKTFTMVLTAIMLLGLTSVTIAQQKDTDDKTAKSSRVAVDVRTFQVDPGVKNLG